MKALFSAALVLVAARAGASTPLKVKRGDVDVKVKVMGTVLADEVFRIKATIDGRVESVLASTYTWRDPKETLAFVVNKELAAMLDAKGSQNVDILEDRWQRVYRPTPSRCPDTCFILKSFLKEKTWIKADSVMFEAASKLKLVARVRPEDVQWVRDGQELAFWPVDEPERVLRGRVTRLILDIQGQKVAPAATFTLIMSPERYFDPGTEWEGRIVPFTKKDVLYVPTEALIRTEHGIYLPVRVSTGITTTELTVITGGVAENQETARLDDSQLAGAERHKLEALPPPPPAPAPAPAAPAPPAARTSDDDEPEAPSRTPAPARAREDEPEDEPRPAPKPAPKKKKRKPPVVIESVDYGEDPYAEPQ